MFQFGLQLSRMWWRTTGNVHWVGCVWNVNSVDSIHQPWHWQRHKGGMFYIKGGIRLALTFPWLDETPVSKQENHYGSCIIIGSSCTPVCRASSSSLQRVSGVKCAGVSLATDQWLFHRGLLVCRQSVTAQQGVTTRASSLCRMAHHFLLVWSNKWWDWLWRRSSVLRDHEVKLVYVCMVCVSNLLLGLIASVRCGFESVRSISEYVVQVFLSSACHFFFFHAISSGVCPLIFSVCVSCLSRTRVQMQETHRCAPPEHNLSIAEMAVWKCSCSYPLKPRVARIISIFWPVL